MLKLWVLFDLSSSNGTFVQGRRVQERLLPPKATPKPLGQARIQSLRTGDLVPDTRLVDHEGREFKLSDLRGKVVVIAFIYTHCNVPSMCPLVTAKLFEVGKLVRQRGLSGVEILVGSFDVRRDVPSRLREFATRYNSDMVGLRLCTGQPAEIGRLCSPSAGNQ